MSKTIIVYIIVGVIIVLMFFCNRKVCVFPIIKRQMQVFKNAKTQKTSIWDIITFIVLPFVLSIIVVWIFKIVIGVELASVLTTVFAFVFTMLFGFATILVGKVESENEIEKQVVQETLLSIITSNILSLVTSVLSVSLIIVKNEIMISVLSTLVFYASFIIILLLLLVSKRFFRVIFYENSIGSEEN